MFKLILSIIHHLIVYNMKDKSKVGRPQDNRDILKVSLLSKTNKSINYSIRLKDGVSITDGLQEIIKQLKNK